MRFKDRVILPIVVLTVCCNANLYGQGVSGAEVLSVPAAARGPGMGNAFVAVADDSESVYYNPSGIGGLKHTELLLVDNMLYRDIRQKHAGIVFSLRDARSSNIENLGAIGFGYTMFENGSETDIDSHVLTASYGKPVFTSESAGEVSLGANVRLITEENVDGDRNRESVDVGALWNLFDKQLSFGAAALNVAGKEGESELPRYGALGTAFRGLNRNIVLSLDVHTDDYENYGIDTGAELWVLDGVALRGGYTSNEPTGDVFTAGAGVSIRKLDIRFVYFHEVAIDYAFVPYNDDLGDTHRVSVKIKFGAD